jgi:hypothetical protein
MSLGNNKKSSLVQSEEEHLFHNAPQLDIFYQSHQKKSGSARVSHYIKNSLISLYGLFFIISLFNPYMALSDLMELTSFILAGIMSANALTHLFKAQVNPVKELAIKGINKALFYGISSATFVISGMLFSL